MPDKEVGYWFKAKRYGWGWGLPANRKGWIAFGAFVAIWLTALLWLVSTGEPTDDLRSQNVQIFLAIFLADIAGFVWLSYKYGETPRWRWGGKTREKRQSAKSKSD